MSGCTGVKGARESGTEGAAIAGGNCDGGCGPGRGVNGSSGMSPGVSLSGVDMFSRWLSRFGRHTTIRIPEKNTAPIRLHQLRQVVKRM